MAVAIAATLLFPALPAIAQGGATAMTPSERHDWERSHRLSKVIGSGMRNKSGEKIGDIRDLVVDGGGTIKLAIVSTGGFLGVGDRCTPCPGSC